MSFKVHYLGFVIGDGQSVLCEYPTEKAGRVNEDEHVLLVGGDANNGEEITAIRISAPTAADL